MVQSQALYTVVHIIGITPVATKSRPSATGLKRQKK